MIFHSGAFHRRKWFTPTNVHDDTLITVSEMGYSSDALSLAWLARLPIHGGLEHIDDNGSALQRGVSTTAISTLLVGRLQASTAPTSPRRDNGTNRLFWLQQNWIFRCTRY